jgi:hypothetical protein
VREYGSPACVQDEIAAIRKGNVVVAAARLLAGEASSPLLGVKITSRTQGGDRWHARVKHNGIYVHIGLFDREEEAGRAVDTWLREILDRPDDVNYDATTGERTGNDPRRHQTAVGTANLVGNAKQESRRHGVSKHGTQWRAKLRVAVCQLDNKGKEFHHSLPLPVCPTVADGSVCACKTKQITYANSADEIAAAMLYDSRVRHYGLDQPPHNKPTNFPIE